MAAHPEFAGSYYGRSRAYRCLGDVDNALSDFNEFLSRKNDTVVTSLTDRADLYLRKGDFAGAIADYTQAIDQQPNFTDRYGKRALAYRLEGDYKRAILDYDAMVKSNDNNPKSLSVGAWPMPGLANSNGRPSISPRLSTSSPTAYYDRAQAKRESDNPDIAIGDYSAAIERDPHFAVAFQQPGPRLSASKRSRARISMRPFAWTTG
jgi:tetratricopeptide (TPR) repeat protein